MSKLQTHLLSLEEVLGTLPASEGQLGSGAVLIAPSSVTREQAVALANHVDLGFAVRDLAAVTAREFGNELLAAGLQVDNAADATVIRVLLQRLAKLLADNQGQFATHFTNYVKMIG